MVTGPSVSVFALIPMMEEGSGSCKGQVRLLHTFLGPGRGRCTMTLIYQQGAADTEHEMLSRARHAQIAATFWDSMMAALQLEGALPRMVNGIVIGRMRSRGSRPGQRPQKYLSSLARVRLAIGGLSNPLTPAETRSNLVDTVAIPNR